MYVFFCRRFNGLGQLKNDLSTVILCLLVGMLPDFDFIMILFLRDPYLHRSLTHSITFTAAAWIAGYFILRARKTLRNPSALAFLLVSGHIFWDFLTVCNRIPYGTMLLWPFSREYYRTPGFLQIFPGFDWTRWKGLVSFNVLVQVAIEAAVFMPMLIAAILIKRSLKVEDNSDKA